MTKDKTTLGEKLVIKEIQKNIQEWMQRIPVVVLGSGASVPHGIPGMWHLGQHLISTKLPQICSSEEHTKGWQEFLSLIETTDLESALTKVNVTTEVTQHIVNSTWHFLNASDLNVYYNVLADRQLLPLSKLFKFLLSGTMREVNVVTPNYDRIAEYAAESAGFCAFSGFNFGYIGERAQNPHPVIIQNNQRLRTVNVWKVHGSFGWFFDSSGVVVSVPPMHQLPPNLSPVIVTPGVEKFRKTHDEPFRSTIQNADRVMGNASAFLCIGYGFNDSHLQPRLIERCKNHEVPLILITKEISSTAHDFFKSGDCKKYIAIENFEGGIRYFTEEDPSGVIVKGVAYWELDNFISLFA
ncbi:SIR2 family protein [Buttiauxella brennerae]|uniref:SIR2 family protein n=1 Tax=Buttiauxella brennerae TaxID=82988 RepID=UPI001AE0A006|nr:SIR2 family protein [Buttiauxella brennerae]